jgi:hypothetical protein
MKHKFWFHIWLAIFVMTLILQACGANPPVVTASVAPTNTAQPPKATTTATLAPSATAGQFALLMPTKTPNLTATHRAEVWKTSQAGQPLNSTRTPRPSPTPNLAATQQIEEWTSEVQAYFDAGYLKTTDGAFRKLDDFSIEWAQLGWYDWRPLVHTARNFYMSGHLKWSSAYRNADISGCGFVFAIQPDGDQYAVFLDRSKVLFVQSDDYFYPMGTTRGTGQVKFDNPYDHPVEADLTLIVEDAYAYVLVDGQVVGEYTLSQSKNLRGNLGLALLSGTNKDFGTRCEMTNLHAWIPNE